MDKWTLWNGETRLRGANIHQRQVYVELDGPEYMGPGPMGPPYTQKDFNRLAALGANYVNISHPGLYTEKPPFGLNKAARDNLDRLLGMIAEANLFAVISFRTGPGRSEFTFVLDNVGDWYDESYLNDTVWTDLKARAAWASMWQYTAARYKDNPVVAGYDLMVEPNAGEAMLNDKLEDSSDPEEFYSKYAGTTYDWNGFYPKLAAAIRRVDKKTPIIVAAMGYSAADWLPYLKPIADKRTVYAVHQYSPYKYTHAEPGDRCCQYPGRCDIDWDGRCDDSFDKTWLEKVVSIPARFKEKTGSPVVVNEFGAHRWVKNGDSFMDDSMELFEKHGFNHAFWVWQPSFQAHGEVQHSFNFRAGPDPKNKADVPSSPLIQVIKKHWSRNNIRPFQ